MQDAIRREITVSAPKERVYAAITNPEQIVRWFPDAVEGKLEAGEQPVLDFGEDGKTRILVEAADPYDYFAFRWIPGGPQVPADLKNERTSLVEFRLEELEGATRVSLVESGFSSFPEKAFADNSGGWDYMMGRLEKLFA